MNSEKTFKKPHLMFRHLGRYGWVPIPLLLIVIVGLWVANLQTVYESRSLMVALNLFFTWLASLCISFLTARGFLRNGQPGLLMFGCGSLLWGLTSLAAAMIVGSNVNPTITVHNLGALVAALCHLVGLLWKGQLKRSGIWLMFGFTGALMISGLIFWAATLGLTPIFFVQGYGGTTVRQVVLIIAIVTFAWVGWRMVSKFRLQLGSFYYWYGLGLALVATGLTGVLLLAVQGGALGWVNRLTQCLGSAYLFIAALMAVKETGAFPLTAKKNARGELLTDFRQESSWGGAKYYILAIVVVGVAMGVRMTAESWIGHGLPPYITFYPAMMTVVLMTGFGPCVIASILMAFISAYWILPPVGQFFIASPVDRLGLAIFTGMNLFMSVIAELYRRNRIKAAAYDREEALRESQDILRRQVELIDPVRAKVIAQEMQRVLRESVATNTPIVKPNGGTTQHIVNISGAIVAGVGLLVLVGWVFDLERLTRVLPGLAMMKANTALCFMVAGLALLFHEKHLVRLACRWLICAVSGLTLVEYISGGDFGLDQLLFLDVPDQHAFFPGRMSAATAIGFLLSSASFLLPKARPKFVPQPLAICVFAIGTVAVLGYIYDMQQLYRFFGFSSVALHTAASFVVLGIGLLFAKTDGLGTLLTSPGQGSHLTRRLLPLVWLIPVLLGWLVLMGLRHGYYGEGMSIALFAMTTIVLLSIIICWSTIILNRGKTVRREAETQLRNLTEVMNHAHEPLIVRELDGTIRAWNLTWISPSASRPKSIYKKIPIG